MTQFTEVVQKMISVELVQNCLQDLLDVKEFWKNPHIGEGGPVYKRYNDLAFEQGKTEWFGYACSALSYDAYLNKAVVKNFGDVLLGIYNNTDKVYDMKHLLHNYPENKEKELFILDDFTLWPKDIYIPFQGRSFLPIVGMNKVESSFECSDKTAFFGDVYLIYGHTNNVSRMKFCYKYILPKNRCGAEFLVSNNQIRPYHTCEKETIIPDYKLDDIVRPFNKTKQLLKRQEVDIYRKELLEKAWHPTRHIDWCLDYQEYKLLCA